jgi:hypothetical protein
MADLLVTRDASGLFSAYVNGNLAFKVMDTDGATRFSGPGNIMYFFMDDFVSLTNYPNLPEAGTGLVDFIHVTTPAAPVPGPIAGAHSLVLLSNVFQFSFPVLRGHIASAQRRWSASRSPIVVVITVTGFVAKDGAPRFVIASPWVLFAICFLLFVLSGGKCGKSRKV